MKSGNRGRRVAAAMLCGASLWVCVAAAEPPPLRRRALLAWLRAGTYRSTYLPEPAPHASAAGGAHGASVRTWYDPILADDLRAGRPRFRKGAAMVKEIYLGDPDGPPMGYSVMRKLRGRSRAGGGWLFFETFDASTGAGPYGRGLRICTGCHADGTDFLLSGYRPSAVTAVRVE